MKNSSKAKGVLAIAGLAGGAFAYWTYKNMTTEEKNAIKNSVNRTGDKIFDACDEIEEKVLINYMKLKDAIMNGIKSKDS